MSGPKPRTVAHLVSGFVGRPPIERAEAERAYGSPLPDSVWKDIVKGFEKFTEVHNVLSSAPRINRNRNDVRSYTLAQKNALKALDAALRGLSEMERDPGMIRAMSLASMSQPGGAASGGELRATLDAAHTALFRAAAIVHRADTPPVVDTSEEDARKRLAQKVLTALEAGGMDTHLTGWTEATLTPESALGEADMTPAERLISALEVHLAETPSAFVRWLRGAIQ